jgi:hypothetical protein
MSLLIALVLIAHGSMHIGYVVCGPVGLVDGADPWLVTGLGASPDVVGTAGNALAGLTFVACLVAALPAVGLLPSRLWAPLVAVASASSAVVLIVFFAPEALPGLAIDALVLWAALARGWRPTPLFGRARRNRSEQAAGLGVRP